MKKKAKKTNPDIGDMTTAVSVTECTGLVAAAPETQEELECELDIMKFSPKNAASKK